MKNKLFFIAHSYHKKTGSCNFIVNYLKEFWDVELYYDESWQTGEYFDYSLIGPKYEACVFWQLIPPKEIFEKIKHDNMIFFPMYDCSSYWRDEIWATYKNIKIFNFSKTLHARLLEMGFNSEHVQYFPKPEKFVKNKANEVFFWQRHENININSVAKIFENQKVKIHIHKAIDPNNNFIAPSLDMENRFGITYSNWFESREEAQNVIKSKLFYIAPRALEGIGMSFLEAMAVNSIVIANNAPTMNEYIENGVNGYLIDFRNPKPLEFKNIEQVQKNVSEFMHNGYENWLKDRRIIVDFIKSGAILCKRIKCLK